MALKNINASSARYESFQDDNDDENNPHESSHNGEILREFPGSSGGDVLGNGNLPTTQRKRIRLRAVETEREYFLNLMNVDLFRKLIMVQAGASAVIVLCQVILYAIVTRQSYKSLDVVAIGLWGPLIFFSVACWLTWWTTRSPSGCSVGTAMAFQIASFFVGLILVIFATISLIQHGQYSYWRDDGVDYDPEVAGRIFCSLMILCSVCVTVTAIFISTQFCKMTCCSRSNAHEAVVFDVETQKV